MDPRIVLNPNKAAPLISLAVVWMVCAACLAWVFWPLSDWLRYPLVYEGDGLWNLFVVKTVLETGWYGSNSHLGAPYVATFLDFAKPESLYLLMFSVVGLVTVNAVLVHNLFYFLGFFLVAGSALLVLQGGFRLRWEFAIAGALLYAFLPFHLMRQPHLFLSNYFVVPITVWMALLISADRPPFFANGRLGIARWQVWLASAVIASTSIYYTFFALALITAVGCLESVRTRRWRSFINAMLVASLVAVFLAANLTPSLLYRAENGTNKEVATRTLGESETYALRPAQLLLPTTDHRLPAFAELARKYESAAPFVNENRSSYLGFLGGVGFLFLLMMLFAGHRMIRENPPLGVAARINVLALSLSVAGGGGVILGLLSSAQFRALNRISVVIAFVSIAGLMILLQRLAQRLPPRSSVGVSALALTILVAVGFLDQIPLNTQPDVRKLAAEYDSDSAFVRDVEALLPDHALVLQLPYTPFPEFAPRFNETSYSHLRGYLHGNKLRWSYGGMKGRRSDAWHASLDQLPLADQVKIAQNSGFRGIWLDRRAFSDGAKAIETGLHSLGIVDVHESIDKTLAFYSLSPKGDLPSDLLPPPMLGAGFYPWEGNSSERWAWSNGDAYVILLNTGVKPRRARLSVSLNSLIERSVNIILDKQTLKAFVLPQNMLENVEITLDLPPGQTKLLLSSPQAPVVPNSADPRRLGIAIRNIKLIEEIAPGQKSGSP